MSSLCHFRRGGWINATFNCKNSHHILRSPDVFTFSKRQQINKSVIISSPDVDHYFHKIAVPPRQRRGSLYELSSAVEDRCLERQIESELVLNVDEVPTRLEEDGRVWLYTRPIMHQPTNSVISRGTL